MSELSCLLKWNGTFIVSRGWLAPKVSSETLLLQDVLSDALGYRPFASIISSLEKNKMKI